MPKALIGMAITHAMLKIELNNTVFLCSADRIRRAINNAIAAHKTTGMSVSSQDFNDMGIGNVDTQSVPITQAHVDNNNASFQKDNRPCWLAYVCIGIRSNVAQTIVNPHRAITNASSNKSGVWSALESVTKMGLAYFPGP